MSAKSTRKRKQEHTNRTPDVYPPATKMLEDNSRNIKNKENKTESPYQKLPTELRLTIWKLVFSKYGGIFELKSRRKRNHLTNLGATKSGMPREALTMKESWDIATSHYFVYKKGACVNVRDSTIEYPPFKSYPRDSQSGLLLAAARHGACYLPLLSPSYYFDKKELAKLMKTPEGFDDFCNRVSANAWPDVEMYLNAIARKYEQLADPRMETLELIFSEEAKSTWQCDGENHESGCLYPHTPRSGKVTGYRKWQDQERMLQEWEDDIKTRARARRLAMTSRSAMAASEKVAASRLWELTSGRKVARYTEKLWYQYGFWECVHSPATLRVIEQHLRLWADGRRRGYIDLGLPSPKWLSHISFVIRCYSKMEQNLPPADSSCSCKIL